MFIDWDKFTAISTGVGALATAAMALFTWRTIVASRRQHDELYRLALDAKRQSEKEHQEALRPVLVIAPVDGVSPLDRSALIEFDPTVRTSDWYAPDSVDT